MKNNLIADKTLLDAATIQESQPLEENQRQFGENKIFQETLMESDGPDYQNEQRIDEGVQEKEELKIRELPSKDKDAEDLEDLFNFDANDENEQDKHKLIQKKELVLEQNSYIVSGYLTQLNSTPEKVLKKEKSNEDNNMEKQNFKRLKPLKNQTNNNNKNNNNSKKQQKEIELNKESKMQKPKTGFPSKYAFPCQRDNKKEEKKEPKELKVQQTERMPEQEKQPQMLKVIGSHPKIESTVAVISPVLSPKNSMYKSKF